MKLKTISLIVAVMSILLIFTSCGAVKNINGTMEIKSKLKKGTEIILSIPFTSENDIFIAGEKNYVYIPEINSFKIEFAQLKLYDRI